MTAAPQQYPVLNPPPPGAYENPEYLLQRFTVRDTGPDVQQRFGYQAACVALYAIISLLDEYPKHVAVYCEVLEDFLLQHIDGTYTAVQVKTRERDREPFRTRDKEILSTLFRFVQYEHDEGRSFHRYVIATNAGFWKEKPTWHNLHHVRQVAKNDSPPPSSELHSLIRNILEASPSDVEIDSGILVNVLCKLELDNELPALGAERDALRNELVRHLGNPTMREIDYVVSDLITFVREHSDRSCEDKSGVRKALSSSPEKADREMRIASRKITSESLRARVTHAANVARGIEAMHKKVSEFPEDSAEPGKHAFRYTETHGIRQTSNDATLETSTACAVGHAKDINRRTSDEH